jgi:hypothetical protein
MEKREGLVNSNNNKWWDDWWFLLSGYKFDKMDFEEAVKEAVKIDVKGRVQRMLCSLGLSVDWERLMTLSRDWNINEPHRTIWEIYRVEGKLEGGISPSELPTDIYVVVRVDAKSNDFLRMQVLPLGGGEPIVISKKIAVDEINPWGWNTFYPPLVLVSHPELGVIVAELHFSKNRRFWVRSGSSSKYWRIWYIPRRYWSAYINVFRIEKKEMGYETEGCGNSN